MSTFFANMVAFYIFDSILSVFLSMDNFGNGICIMYINVSRSTEIKNNYIHIHKLLYNWFYDNLIK